MICNAYETDYIFRYWPKHDQDTYLREIDYTAKGLERYYPDSIKSQLETFHMAKAVGKVGSVLILGMFCYRLERYKRAHLGSRA